MTQNFRMSRGRLGKTLCTLIWIQWYFIGTMYSWKSTDIGGIKEIVQKHEDIRVSSFPVVGEKKDMHHKKKQNKTKTRTREWSQNSLWLLQCNEYTKYTLSTNGLILCSGWTWQRGDVVCLSMDQNTEHSSVISHTWNLSTWDLEHAEQTFHQIEKVP